MAFTTLQSVVDALPGQEFKIHKIGTAVTAAAWQGLWGASGFPAAGAGPSSGMAGDVPTNATTGAIPFVNPASGNTHLAYADIITASGTSSSGYALYLYDRLVQQSGIVVTTTGAQTVNTTAITRPDANGEDVEAWLHVYAATGAGAATPTISYTNSAGTSGQTGTCIGYTATSAINRCYPFQLASGDTGVKSIQSITLGTSLTSGTVGLVLRRKVAIINVDRSGSGSYAQHRFDAIALGLPRIYDSSCLELVVHMTTGTSPHIMGSLNLING